MPRRKPGVRARGLGAELGTLRTNSGLSVTDVSAQLGWSKSTLSRLENGRRNITVEEVAALLALYGVTGQARDRLTEMARNDDEPGWWEVGLPGLPSESATLASYEAEASVMVNWEPLLIPGLLQTMSYTRAYMRADGIPYDQIELRLTARLRRQQVLQHTEVEYSAFIGEGALRANIGDREVMLEQLIALNQRSRSVRVRVVPTRVQAHPGMVGGFFMLQFPTARPVVHVELARSAVFLDETPMTGPYRDALQRIDAVALNTRESQRMITGIIEELR
ncbi:helix-turn-helix domain-containing protein [Parasphingorhabdus pacifica]